MLRCFRFSYAIGGDVIRWVDDVGEPFAQQVLEYRCDGERLKYTGDDPYAGFFLEGIPQLIEAGRCEELA